MTTTQPSVYPLPRWIEVLEVVDEFRLWLKPDFPKLEIVELNDSDWSTKRYEQEKLARPEDFYVKGVYLHFNPPKKLQYVGHAELQYVGHTLVTFENRALKKPKAIRKWTDVIKFPLEYVFFAPALEVLLIDRLEPPHNIEGKDLEIPVAHWPPLRTGRRPPQ